MAIEIKNYIVQFITIIILLAGIVIWYLNTPEHKCIRYFNKELETDIRQDQELKPLIGQCKQRGGPESWKNFQDLNDKLDKIEDMLHTN